MRGSWAALKIAGLLSSFANHAFATSAQAERSLVERQDIPTAATFVYSPSSNADDAKFTFTLRVNPANSDLWFRMSAPSQYSWIAVGTGTEMVDSTMFFVYQGKEDNSVILSGRKATGNVEPSYSKDLGLNLGVPPPEDNDPNGIKDDNYFVAGYCPNCTTKANISPNNKFQAFIFAIGPQGHEPRSDDRAAPLRRHTFYGHFSMDMTQAHGRDMPLLGTKMVAATAQRNTDDHEYASSGHAFVMGLAFVIVFPLGIFMLRVLGKVNLHMYAQTLGFVLVVIGLIGGIIVSKTYNRSKDFNNPHQIIGIIVFVLLIVQWVLGFLHHRTYKRTQQPTWMIKPHKFGIGPLTMILGVINAALGFKFALAGRFNLAYVPIVIAVFILLVISIGTKHFFSGRRKKNTGEARFGGLGPAPAYNAAQSYDHGPYDSDGPSQGGAAPYGAGAAYGGGYESGRSDIALHQLVQPPSYSHVPVKPRELL